MKIRNGFVSNSSSSSFIIRGGEIEEIAISMLKTVIEDFSDWDKDWDKKSQGDIEIYDTWHDNLEIALKRKDVLSGKIGIVMPSCNYDTYIVKKDDVIYISTANNHTWDIDATDVEYEEEGYDSVRQVIDESFFFNVRNKLIHSKENDDSTGRRVCPKCKKTPYSFVTNLKGQNICTDCYKGVLRKTKEQLEAAKVEKLLKNPPKTDAITSLEV